MLTTDTASVRAQRAPIARTLLPFFIGFGLLMAVLLAATLLWTIPRGYELSFDFRSMYAAGYLERTHSSQLFSLEAQRAVQFRRVLADQSPLPFFHPPFEALLFVPFSLLPYPAAYAAFLLLNGIITAVCVIAGIRLFSVTIPFIQPRPGLMLLFFFPLYMTIMAGQDSIVFLLILLLAWNQMEQSHDRSAGMILALGLMKPQFVLPFVLLMSLRRGRKLATGFAWGAAGVLVLSFICSPASPLALVHLLKTSSGGQTSAAWYVRPLMMANLRGVVYATLGSHLSQQAQMFVTLAASALLLVVVAFYLRRLRSELLALSVSVLACVLVSYHAYPHDLMVLAIPILGIAREMLRWRTALIALLYVSPWIFFWIGDHSLYLTAFAIAAALGAILMDAQQQSEPVPVRRWSA